MLESNINKVKQKASKAANMAAFLFYIRQFVCLFFYINIIYLLAGELLKKLVMIHFYFSIDYFLTYIIPTIKTDLDKSHYLQFLKQSKSNLKDLVLLHSHSKVNHPRQLRFYEHTDRTIDIMIIELYNHKTSK